MIKYFLPSPTLNNSRILFNKLSFKVVILLCMIIPVTVMPQTFDENLSDQLWQALDDERLSRNLTGISSAVIVPDQGLWTGVSGFSVPEENDSLRPDMLFGVASVTKTFTAALILQLQEEGHLSLDDPLHAWLPSFDNIDSTITIQQLLNHTSGIDDYAFHPDFFFSIFSNPFRWWQPEEILETFVETPEFTPGSAWGYSNTNYILLGMIIREITGPGLAAQYHDRFFAPLGLTETFFPPEDSLIGPISHNWMDVTNNGELNDLFMFPRTALASIAWSAGSIVSIPENIVRWSHELYSGNVLNPNSMQAMLTFVDINSTQFTGYGLGTQRYHLQGRDLWGHSGIVAGYRSAMFYSPQDDVSIVVLVNQFPAEVIPVVSRLLEVILQYTPTAIGNDFANEAIPAEFTLLQNYPNPFNPATTIEFELSTAADVKLTIFNNLGERVKILADGRQPPGMSAMVWDGRDALGNAVSSGVYFYKLQSGSIVQSRKMILIR